MKIQIVVCDNDRRTPARTYEITADDGRSVGRDLCETCAAPLEVLLGDAGGSAPAAGKAVTAPVEEKPVTRVTRRRTRVTTLEEIEALKRAAAGPDPEEARRQTARRAGA